MTASNHALTGVLLIASVTNPVVGLSVAFLSHFMLDAVPHWNYGGIKSRRSGKYIYLLAVDAVIAGAILLSIALLQPVGWVLLLAGALCAMSPDLMWLPYLAKELRGNRLETDKLDAISRLHKIIQHEYSWGIFIELAWFAVIGYLVVHSL